MESSNFSTIKYKMDLYNLTYTSLGLQNILKKMEFLRRSLHNGKLSKFETLYSKEVIMEFKIREGQ